ncbi:MAG: ribose-phosphate pyrophosphokinase, partial [Clostridia bacterium]|nr:ribose-phosphate pyrophosphokinase [Clostridia bacterium]
HKNGIIDAVFTTNLIYSRPGLLDCPWYHQVDMSKYVALLINELNSEHSISEFLDPIKRIEAALDKYRNL